MATCNFFWQKAMSRLLLPCLHPMGDWPLTLIVAKNITTNQCLYVILDSKTKWYNQNEQVIYNK